MPEGARREVNFWRLIGHAVFTGDRGWAWRRRVTFAGCATALACVVQATWFETDRQWAAVLLAQSWTAFGATLAIYVGAAGYDDHQKRKLGADDKAAG